MSIDINTAIQWVYTLFNMTSISNNNRSFVNFHQNFHGFLRISKSAKSKEDISSIERHTLFIFYCIVYVSNPNVSRDKNQNFTLGSSCIYRRCATATLWNGCFPDSVAFAYVKCLIPAIFLQWKKYFVTIKIRNII